MIAVFLASLSLAVQHHEARIMHVPVRHVHVTCAGQACQVRFCASLGWESINGGPHRPTPAQHVRYRLVVVDGHYRDELGTLTVSGRCRP